MLETQLYFNFRDLFRAPRLALGRRMLVMLQALMASYLVFLPLAYLAMLASGMNFGSIWTEYHLLPPFLGIEVTGLLPHLLLWIGYLFSFVAVYLGLTAVAKITIKEFKGDLFYSRTDGWKWAFGNWFPVFFGPVSIAVVIAFFVLIAIILGWLAQWPVLDILFYGLLFAIFLPTSVFLVYSFLSLLVGVAMSPSIVACAEEDTMGSMFGAYTLLWNQPFRMIFYWIIVALLTFAGYHLYGLFLISGLKLLELIFGLDWLMGPTLIAIKDVGISLFGQYEFLPTYFQVPAVLGSVFEVNASGTSVTQGIAGVLVGIVSFTAFLSIPAYALATLGTGLSTAFIVLTRYKDDEDLIKRKDADERAEEIAEETDSDASDEPESGERE